MLQELLAKCIEMNEMLNETALFSKDPSDSSSKAYTQRWLHRWTEAFVATSEIVVLADSYFYDAAYLWEVLLAFC